MKTFSFTFSNKWKLKLNDFVQCWYRNQQVDSNATGQLPAGFLLHSTLGQGQSLALDDLKNEHFSFADSEILFLLLLLPPKLLVSVAQK